MAVKIRNDSTVETASAFKLFHSLPANAQSALIDNGWDVFVQSVDTLSRQAVRDFARKYLLPGQRIELDVVPAPKTTASAEGAQR